MSAPGATPQCDTPVRHDGVHHLELEAARAALAMMVLGSQLHRMAGRDGGRDMPANDLVNGG